jgi:hypothetical protein
VPACGNVTRAFLHQSITVDRSLVLVADTVWETWREREAEFKKPAIAVLLTADVPPETAFDALAAAIGDVMQPRLAKAEAAGPGEDEFIPGYCSYARVPQGVLLRIDEGPDDFEGLLQGIAEGLRARGIEGTFDLYEPDEIPEIPELVDLFECHLRLEGDRVLQPNGRALWKPTSEALAKAVEAGIAWCRQRPRPAAVSDREPTAARHAQRRR